MTISPVQVESELLRLSRLLEETVDAMPRLGREAAETEVAYKREQAKALLLSDAKTVSDREAQALQQTADLLLARRIAESAWDVARERARSLSVQINALQTIASNMRGFTRA